jgi:RND family efflux transporter MFP subunit
VLKILLPILILAAAIGVAAVMIASRPPPVRTVAEPPALLVQVAEAKREMINFVVRSHGTVAPRTETTLVAEASGQIIDVSPGFVSGGFFQKGDVLIRIDPRNYESEVKRAQANLARANTQFATQATLQNIPQGSWESLRRSDPFDLRLRKPQVQEAIASVQAAEADLDKARGDLDRTMIRAPYDGLVREKLADVGQYVNTGSQVATTYAIDVAEIRLPVTQQDLQYLDMPKLVAGEPIEVTLRANLVGVEQSWSAQVSRSEGVFDRESRVLYLVAQKDLPYSEPLLPLGTFVAAEIQGRSGGELFKIPRHSMQRGSTLWVVDDEALIYPREVVRAGQDNEYVYIASGLEEGERYCVTPIDNPLPGMKVRFSG